MTSPEQIGKLKKKQKVNKRSNLLDMGVLPLQFPEGASSDTLGLTGAETYTIEAPETLASGQMFTVQTDAGKSFEVKLRIDTEVELTYFRHGGILNYMVRKMI